MLFIIITVIHVFSCVFLVVVVLLQSGKDAGLSGAFGLGGGGQTIFGARAGDVLAKVTVAIAVTFICTCLLFTRIEPGGVRSIVTSIPEPEEKAEPPADKGIGTVKVGEGEEKGPEVVPQPVPAEKE